MRNVRLALFAVFFFLLLCQFIAVGIGLMEGYTRADFRQLYVAGYMARTGHGPDMYSLDAEEQLQSRLVNPEFTLPFDHLAFEALFFAPFSLLNYRAAYNAFVVFNILVLFAAQRMFRPYLAPLEILGKFVPEAVFCCFTPAALAIMQGQDSIVLLVLMALTFIALDKGKDIRAGILLSLGLFKFQYVVPIVLLYLLWRRWRFALGAALGGSAVLGLSTWVAGFSGMKAFVGTMLEMSIGLAGHVQERKFGTYPDAMPNLRGFLYAVAGSHISASAMQIAVVAATVVVILLAWRMPPSLPVAILAVVLVSYHGLIHDASILALPLGIVLVRSVAEKNLLLGISDMFVFACPAILLIFFHGRFYPLAILVLALLLVPASRSRGSEPTLAMG